MELNNIEKDKIIKDIVLYGALDKKIIKDIDELEDVKKIKEPFNDLQDKYMKLKNNLIEDFAKYKELNNETVPEFKELINLVEEISIIWESLDNINSMLNNALLETQSYNFIEGFKINKIIRENI